MTIWLVNNKSGRKVPVGKRSVADSMVGTGRYRYSETETTPTVSVPVPQAEQSREPAPESAPTPPAEPEPEPEGASLPPVIGHVNITLPMSGAGNVTATEEPAAEESTPVVAEQEEQGEEAEQQEGEVRISPRTGKPVRQYRRRDMQAEDGEQ